MIFAYDLTWPELLESKIGVATRSGHLIGGPDRKTFLADPAGLRAAWLAWQKDCQKAEELYPKVQEFFQRTKHLSRPPEGDSPETNLIPSTINYEAAKEVAVPISPPRFTWSYSSISNFFTCPAQFAAYRYFKTVRQEDTEATIWGTRVHETGEHYLLFLLGKPFKKELINLEDLPLVKPYCDAIVSAGGEVWAERKLAITENLKPCDFFASTAWGRGVVDVAVKKGNKLTVFDYKTGKIKDDPFQLKVFCAFLALHHPEVQEFDAKFIWLKHGKITGLTEPLTRADIAFVWQEILNKVSRVKRAWDDRIFQPMPSGLCKGWCAVKQCPHNRGPK